MNDGAFIVYLKTKERAAIACAEKLDGQNRAEGAMACRNYAIAYRALIGEIENGFHTPDELPPVG